MSVKKLLFMALLLAFASACRTPGGTPLEPEQTFALPDGTLLVEGGVGGRGVSPDYPRAIDASPKTHWHGSLWWGVTDRLTLSLPIPHSGAYLVREGARSQTVAQWGVGGGFAFRQIRDATLFGSAGLTELVMLSPNLHLAFQFGAGAYRDGLRTAFLGDAALGLMLRLGDRVRLHPAIQGYHDWQLAGLTSAESPFGADGIRFGGVLDRGRRSAYARQPLLMVHLVYGLSLFANSTFDVRQGYLYEQLHVAGFRFRY